MQSIALLVLNMTRSKTDSVNLHLQYMLLPQILVANARNLLSLVQAKMGSIEFNTQYLSYSLCMSKCHCKSLNKHNFYISSGSAGYIIIYCIIHKKYLNVNKNVLKQSWLLAYLTMLVVLTYNNHTTYKSSCCNCSNCISFVT